jgi:hypothetical protein
VLLPEVHGAFICESFVAALLGVGGVEDIIVQELVVL